MEGQVAHVLSPGYNSHVVEFSASVQRKDLGRVRQQISYQLTVSIGSELQRSFLGK